KFYYITLLRDPVSRYLSEWRHVQRGATWKTSLHMCDGRTPTPEELPSCYEGTDWSGCTLQEFMDCPYNLANNRQVRMLADLSLVGCYNMSFIPENKRAQILLESAKKNLKDMAFFGLTEFQRKTQYLFERTFNLKFIRPFMQYNSTRAGGVEVDNDTIRRIEELNDLDMQLYDYAKDLFQQRYQYKRQLERMEQRIKNREERLLHRSNEALPKEETDEQGRLPTEDYMSHIIEKWILVRSASCCCRVHEHTLACVQAQQDIVTHTFGWYQDVLVVARLSNLEKSSGNIKFYYITLLRDPVSRYLSEWRHVQRGATWKTSLHMCDGRTPTPEELPSCYEGTDWSGCTLQEFMDCPYNLANNRQVRMLADLSLVGCYNMSFIPENKRAQILLESAKKNLKDMAFFGLTEFQRKTQYLFERTFNLKFIRPFMQYNSTRAGGVEVDNDTIRRIEELNDLDMQLYDYAKDLFQQRYQYKRQLERMEQRIKNREERLLHRSNEALPKEETDEQGRLPTEDYMSHIIEKWASCITVELGGVVWKVRKQLWWQLLGSSESHTAAQILRPLSASGAATEALWRKPKAVPKVEWKD
ncbi:Heparan-sulfate 6-O-sulfotransferase 1, partial [Lamprotornis superbus]